MDIATILYLTGAAALIAIAIRPYQRLPSDDRSEPPSPPRNLSVLLCGALIIVTWGFGFFVNLINVLQRPRDRVQVDLVQGPTPDARSIIQISLITFSLIAGLLILTHLKNLRHRKLRPLLLVLLPYGATLLSDAFNGQAQDSDSILYPIGILAIWLAAPPLRLLRILGWLTIVTAIASIALALWDSSIGTTEAPIIGEKAIWPSLLAGPYSHPNVLGLGLALGLPFVFLIKQRWAYALGFGVTSVGIIWSGNRGSMYAAAIAVLLSSYLTRRPSSRRVPSVVAVIVAATTVVLPLIETDPAAYSERGQIWIGSISSWQTSPFIGLGTSFYNEIAQYYNPLGLTAFNGHNMFIHSLTTGGVLGVTAIALVLCTAYFGALSWPPYFRATGLVAVVSVVANGLLQNTILYTGLPELAYVGWISIAILILGSPEPESYRRTDIELSGAGLSWAKLVRTLAVELGEDGPLVVG